MPSTTPRQANFMAACAHGADYASCPPDKVSHEFNQADKGTGMIHRLRRMIGGPIGPPGGANPQIMNYLAALRARMNPGMQMPMNPMSGAPGGVQPGIQPGMQPHPGVMPPMPMNPGNAMQTMQASVPGSGAPPPQPGMQMPMNPGNAMPQPHPGMPPGVMPQMPMNPGNGMFRPMNNPPPRPMSGAPAMAQPMPMMPGAPRPMMAGGGLMPPGVRPSSPLPPMRPVSPLTSLIGQGMAGRHAGFPGPRKPRVPLPGQLRNINQTINHSKERLAGIAP